VCGRNGDNFYDRATEVEVWKLDLSDFDSVKAFATKCDQELTRLDVFLSNAAVLMQAWKQTKDGWETALVNSVSDSYISTHKTVPGFK
jgi:retinol dehydrogenase 12